MPIASYDSRSDDKRYQAYVDWRRTIDESNRAGGGSGPGFGDSRQDWQDYQSLKTSGGSGFDAYWKGIGGEDEAPPAAGGEAGGAGAPVPLVQAAMGGLRSAQTPPEPAVTGYVETPAPGANPALGQRLYPIAMKQLALLPRVY